MKTHHPRRESGRVTVSVGKVRLMSVGIRDDQAKAIATLKQEFMKHYQHNDLGDVIIIGLTEAIAMANEP